MLARLKKGLASLKEKVSSGDPDDVGILTAMCFLHDKVGNQRGVYAGLQLLERYYNKSKKRETNLYNLVRVSSLLGLIMDTEKHGKVYLDNFPESDKAESVRRMMLSSLFFAGEYEKSLRVAESMFDDTAQGDRAARHVFVCVGGELFLPGSF